MSWGVNLDDLAAARDALLAEVGERPRSHALERLARVHRWLGDEDAARARFADAARAAEAVLERWGRDDAGAIARVGSLLWRARDVEAAVPWLERALSGGLAPDQAAAVAYLLGEYGEAVTSAERAVADERGGGESGGIEGGALGGRGHAPAHGARGDAPAHGARSDAPAHGARGDAPVRDDAAAYPWAAAVGALARARRDGDAAAAGSAGDSFADLIRVERTPPDEESGSSSLSLFDWLEEAARVRAQLLGGKPPTHAELLEQARLLRAERAPERAPAPPDAGPSRPGTATIAYPNPDGGDLEARVTVDDAGDIHFTLHPGRDLRASLVQVDGMWRARLGDTELPGSFRGPRAAKRAVWDPLREQPDGQWAVALLDRLFRESFRL